MDCNILFRVIHELVFKNINSQDKLLASTSTSTTTQQKQQQLKSPPLPVVVFIHGDSYEIGTGNAYDGSSMAASGQHIVVTINFRLGVLGFLSTGDSSAKGNYALIDQAAALMWIHDNIEAFGGDPNQVTLLGHGCGAAMINMLVISPIVRGKGLFNKIILQSGTALSPWAFVKDPLSVTTRLAEKLHCLKSRIDDFSESSNEISSQILLQCLKQIPYEGLLSAAAGLMTPRFHFLFGPVVDGEVIPLSQGIPSNLNIYADPQETSATTEKFTVPASEPGQNFSIMVGYTLGEGQAFFNQTFWDEGLSQEAMWRIVRTLIHNSFQYHRQTILDILLHQYRNWESSGLTLSRGEVRNSLYELLGDAMYASPAIKLASVAGEHWTAFRHLQDNQKEQYDEGHFFGEGKFTGQSNYYGFKGAYRNYKKESQPFDNPIKVYVYCYNKGAKEPTAGNSSQHGPQKKDTSWPRSIHGDDLAYAFAAPITDGIDPFVSTYTWQDKSFNEAMLRLWSNFIRTGSPNDNPAPSGKKLKISRLTPFIPSIELVHWPMYNTSSQQILLLESQKFSVKSFFRASKMALWLDLLPNIHKTSHHLDQCLFHQLDHSDNSTYFDGALVPVACPPPKPLSASSPKRAHLSNVVPAWSQNKKVKNQSIFSAPPPAQQSRHSIYQKITSPGLYSSFQFKEHHRHYQETEQDGLDSFSMFNSQDLDDESFEGATSKTAVRPMQLSNNHQGHNLPLVVVIGVGCVLLSGNIFLFIAVYCQKKRRGRRKNFSCRSIHLSDNETGDQYYHKQHHQQTPMYSADLYRKDSKPLTMLDTSIDQNNLNSSFKQRQQLQGDSSTFPYNVSPYRTSKESCLEATCLKSSKRMDFSDENDTLPSKLHERGGRFEFSTSQKGVKFLEPDDIDFDASLFRQHSNLHLAADLDQSRASHGKASHCYNNNSTIILEQLASSQRRPETFVGLQNHHQQPTSPDFNFIDGRVESRHSGRNFSNKISETAIDCDILNDTLSGISTNPSAVSVSETSSVYSSYPTPTKPLVSFTESPINARKDADV